MQQSEVVQSGHGFDFDAVLRGASFDLAAVRRELDALDSEARVRAIRSLSGKAQAQLFDAAKGVGRRTLEDLVPSGVPPLSEVPHYGKNSLPVFTHFAKVFCRPEANAKELWGYNRSGGMIETFVGPGYYVAYETADGEVLIDYTRQPASKPETWPKMLSNHARLSRFVYADMIDALRAVSAHVSIGRALRHGKVQDNWFVLCRGS